MEALLTRWLGGDADLPVRDEAALTQVRDRVREVAAAAGMDRLSTEEMVLVATELGRNQLIHARYGWMNARSVERDGVRGLEIVAADRGPGIADPTTALRGGASTAGTFRSGLPSVLRFSHEVDVDVRRGEGTCLWVRRFAAPVAVAPQYAVLGRPHAREPLSGDDASVARSDRGLAFLIADGLGHGYAAREASAAAIGTFASAASSPTENIRNAHDGFRGTRGGVALAARLDHTTGELEMVGVGNITARVVGRARSRSFVFSAAVLGRGDLLLSGASHQRDKLAAGEILLAFSDGISSRAHLDDRRDLLNAPLLVIADYLLTTFGQPLDDALVVVVR